MPRVMLLGRLPLAGQYRPPPGRLLQAGPGLYGLGNLGVTMEEICNDPATMFIQAGTSLFAGAASSGCQTRDGRQVDASWCAASTGVTAANTSLNTACAAARTAAQNTSSDADPTELETLRAQLEIERLRAQGSTNLAMASSARAGAATDYKPYIYGGIALAAVIGLIVVFKKR